MRVVDAHNTAEATAANLSRLMDEFASVSVHAGAPAIGGYRVINTQRTQPPRRRPAPAPVRSRRTPIRMTGTLAALIISSLGVAAFSGPATCPQCGDSETTVALEQSAAPSLTRFAYTRTNVARAYRAVPQSEAIPDGEADLASVPIVPEGRAASIYETFQLADDGQPVEASPISTAAIEPTAYRPQSAAARESVSAQRLTKLTAEEAEPIRLASADPVEVEPTSSPAIDVRTVELSDSPADEPASEPKQEIVAEPVAQPIAKPHERSTHKHASAKRRTYRAYRSVVESRESKRKRLANIPPWAEKMFTPNWQSRAFDY